jgi:hypothetical protein
MERYRIADDVGIYFVTMSVVDWLPVFVSEGACQILTDSLNFCHDTITLAAKDWSGARSTGVFHRLRTGCARARQRTTRS